MLSRGTGCHDDPETDVHLTCLRKSTARQDSTYLPVIPAQLGRLRQEDGEFMTTERDPDSKHQRNVKEDKAERS